MQPATIPAAGGVRGSSLRRKDGGEEVNDRERIFNKSKYGYVPPAEDIPMTLLN
jgi:hypothetical protein